MKCTDITTRDVWLVIV